MDVLKSHTSRALALIVSIGLLHGACKEPTTAPEQTGTIVGNVVHASTQQPIAGASITTSPATSAPVTDSEGRFTLEDVATGEYAVSAEKPDFETKSVSVTVRARDTTEVNLLLQPERSAAEVLDASITNWWSDRLSEDSVVAEVEYRVENVTPDSTPEYELYFKIFTPRGVFTHEVTGNALHPAETDLGNFREFVRDASPDSVVIDDIFFPQAG